MARCCSTLEGARVGQVNGLSVLDVGDYAFGRPVRITASAGPGRGALVSIEREAELSGHIHDKGFLTLSGYLREQYGGERRIALSATLTFEQSYEHIDGDSAASAELYALLSELAGVALRQDIAITGSVNQHGEVQAIGGVNEKIEGFHRACRLAGADRGSGRPDPAGQCPASDALARGAGRCFKRGAFMSGARARSTRGSSCCPGSAGGRGADGRFPEGACTPASNSVWSAGRRFEPGPGSEHAANQSA